jgi:tetratricopeptide (TPR) repeat protein
MAADETPLQIGIRQAGEKLRAQDFAAAKALLTKLSARAPKIAQIWSMLGYVHASEKDYSKALNFYYQSYLIDPANVPVILSIAKLQKLLGFKEAHLRTLETALKADPHDKAALQMYGEGLAEEENPEAAAAAFTAILNRAPDDLNALYGLAFAHENMGNSGTAAELYGKIIISQRANADKSAALGAACKIASFPHEYIVPSAELAPLLDLAFTSSRRIKVMFARAAIHVRAGPPQEAWEQLLLANEAMQSEELAGKALAEKASVLSHARNLRRETRAAQPRQAMTANPRPVFILGPSRSGKSLLEKMLGTNDWVRKSYEADIVDRCLSQLAQELALTEPLIAWRIPDWLKTPLSGIFGSELKRVADGKRFVTNTNPSYIENVGLLSSISEDALFIFVSRNKQDQAFRIFEKLYGSGNSYAYDMKSIFSYIDVYTELASQWTRLFPSRCLSVTYEALVTGDTEEYRRVAEFVGVEFESRSIDIHSDAGCSLPFLEKIERLLRTSG